jgi:signal peptidase II
MEPRRIGLPFFVFWFIGLLALDQAVKAWARNAFEVGQSPGFPFPGFFELTLTYNKGIAFGMFEGGGRFFAPVAIVISLMALHFCWKNPNEPRMSHFALAMLASGAIGNMIDRVWLGKVTDMFWLRAINFPVFNIADACITVGAVLLGIRFLFERKPEATPVEKPITTP